MRIVGSKPGSYNGQLTLAVTHDTVVERGDGPAPVHHTCRANIWENGSDLRGEQRLKPCTLPNTVGGAVARPAEVRFEGAETWVFPVEACPDWRCEREDVRVVGSESGAEGRADAVADD